MPHCGGGRVGYREALDVSERTSVVLDVHARTTTAWALDGETGEVFSERLDAETHNVLAWVATLPQPAAVADEAVPTAFVLARALDGIGIRCVVAAPSFGLAVEVGDWQRFTGATIGAYLGLVPSEPPRHQPDPGPDHQDRQQPCPAPAG
ncbi:hypothetical protein [Streptomyces himalayensis]|uniref:hypothetical protein n=1 Tax=Streptomyces himalayensis TaxID=2820085 RepID=UPI001C69BDA9|nr:hypothetical protein [Streptomyces himalayensis]